EIIRERNSTASTGCGRCQSGQVGHSLGGGFEAMRPNRPGEPDTGNPYVRFDEGRSGNAEPTTSVGSIRLFPLRLLYFRSLQRADGLHVLICSTPFGERNLKRHKCRAPVPDAMGRVRSAAKMSPFPFISSGP